MIFDCRRISYRAWLVVRGRSKGGFESIVMGRVSWTALDPPDTPSRETIPNYGYALSSLEAGYINTGSDEDPVPFILYLMGPSRPLGVANIPVNTQALEHYDDLIKNFLEYGISPIVTLLHADNPVLIVMEDEDDFLYYVKQVLTRYVNRVPIWITSHKFASVTAQQQ